MTTTSETADPTDVGHGYFALVVPRILVKTVKDGLDSHGRFDKWLGIKPVTVGVKYELIDETPDNVREGSFFIPLSGTSDEEESLPKLISLIGLDNYGIEISLVRVVCSDIVRAQRSRPRLNLLAQAVQQWLQDSVRFTHDEFSQNRSELRDAFDSCNWGYTIYPPLLLLPPRFLENLCLMLKTDVVVEQHVSLYQLICEKVGVDHIALNSPIINTVTTGSFVASFLAPERQLQDDTLAKANVLRSPTGLKPLHGDFGPSLPIDHIPTSSDFASAFWCTTQQNGIFQTWAPRYVMFSQGNISEKTRILNLSSLNPEGVQIPSQETSAVDLYAGIGYFAFSYARAGVRRILCWEINPWSVEGLRKGARMNGWTNRIVQRGENYTSSIEENEQFTVFQESNEHAVTRIKEMKDIIPPVKHVNCGYLPTSSESWITAAQALDSTGGWIHAHENVAQKDIEERKAEIVRTFARIIKMHRDESLRGHWRVYCDRVEQVKSYAPGIMHCVFDIVIIVVG